MTRSMKTLAVASFAIGLFELASVVPNSHEGGASGGVLTALFALGFLGSALALWRRQSRVAAGLAGLLLLVDTAGLPFYGRNGWLDWATQLAFGLVGLIGIVASVQVLRPRRRRPVVPTHA